jgi:hypothetical protein
MFQSCEYKNYLGEKDGIHTWKYKLTDSEFGTVFMKFVAGEFEGSRIVDIITLIIQEYSKRNLNVAANLALALVWYDKKYAYLSIQQMIDLNKKYNTLFPKYEEDLQKYLLLL